jgi:hypothetical protein
MNVYLHVTVLSEDPLQHAISQSVPILSIVTNREKIKY